MCIPIYHGREPAGLQLDTARFALGKHHQSQALGHRENKNKNKNNLILQLSHAVTMAPEEPLGERTR